MLLLPPHFTQQIIAYCLDGLPNEACGLLAGKQLDVKQDPSKSDSSEALLQWYPTRNDAVSAKVYTVNPLDYMKADRDAESKGMQIIGVFHSHTHTDPYPSPTDVAKAPDPNWHYVLVSLKYEIASIRSYYIKEGKISEEIIVSQSSYNY